MKGQVETALLVIHDLRQAAKSTGAGQLAGVSASGLAGAVSSALSASTKSVLASGSAPTVPKSQEKIFQVQFNPSELTLNASNVPVSKVNSKDGTSRTLTADDPSLTLRVMLYFDDMQVYDSFMVEKFTAGLTAQGVSNVVNAVKTATGKNKHSVQPQVEALIAALRNPHTRTISFRWANFFFIGQLNNVRAEYTMFSTSGRPVRAKLMLQIRHELDPTMLNQWYQDYNTAFGVAASNLNSKTQKIGNVLNVNL